MAEREIDGTGETRRLVEASAWRVALFEAGLEATEGFEAWLASDPLNTEAWRRVSAVWDRFGDEAMEPELIIARRDALERARRQKQRRFSGPVRWRRHRPALAAAACAVLALGGLIGLGVWQVTRPQVYQTALGERRAITLADGSHIALDSNSRLEVRLLRRRRALDLLRGQARFEVAHDLGRPFTVHAGDKTVVATGTSFNVDLIGADVIVTLIEGRVSILQARSSRPTFVGSAPAPASAPLVVARLVPGEQLIAPQPAAGGPEAPLPAVVVEQVSLDRATAWEAGQLVFDDEPLTSVAERVARYSHRSIVVDRDVASMRLSGVFNAGDTAAFVEAVQRVLPVIAETGDDGGVHLRGRGVVQQH